MVFLFYFYVIIYLTTGCVPVMVITLLLHMVGSGISPHSLGLLVPVSLCWLLHWQWVLPPASPPSLKVFVALHCLARVGVCSLLFETITHVGLAL